MQITLDGALEHIGPLIADAVVYNISGSAARSELDKVCDPLKKLVVRSPSAMTWLQNSLFSASFGSELIKDNEKSIFLQKLMK